jgi:hypothetical protein
MTKVRQTHLPLPTEDMEEWSFLASLCLKIDFFL